MVDYLDAFGSFLTLYFATPCFIKSFASKEQQRNKSPAFFVAKSLTNTTSFIY